MGPAESRPRSLRRAPACRCDRLTGCASCRQTPGKPDAVAVPTFASGWLFVALVILMLFAM